MTTLCACSTLSGRQGDTNLPTNLNSDRARAEALFKKERQLREGEKAMAEYQAGQQAIREKTARLRALRLARVAAKRSA